jgi:hypothetical protein
MSRRGAIIPSNERRSDDEGQHHEDRPEGILHLIRPSVEELDRYSASDEHGCHCERKQFDLHTWPAL